MARISAALALGAAALAIAAHAHAQAPAAGAVAGAVIDDRGGEGAIDWTRGLVISGGAAAADLRARTPEVARVGAERRARARARDALRDLVAQVPLASGRRVGDVAASDTGAAEALERALERAIDVDIDYGTDGSVVVRLGLPLELLRSALGGAAPPPGGAEVSGVLVRAGGVLDEPALGLALRAGDEIYTGPVVFRRAGARRDPRLGGEVLEAEAESVHDGAVAIDLDGDSLARARRAGALVVIVL